MHLNVDQDLTSKECFLKVEDEEESDSKTALHPILSIKNNSHILVSENIYQDIIHFESKWLQKMTFCQIVFLYFTKYLIMAECIGFFQHSFRLAVGGILPLFIRGYTYFYCSSFFICL